MVEKIINSLSKISHTTLKMDILMEHIIDPLLNDKWAFTLNTYDNLVDSIRKYQDGNLDSIIKNYIVNDYETLTQMIDEFKEDIYPLFDVQATILLDTFSVDELKELLKVQNNVIKNYHSFSVYIQENLATSKIEVMAYIKTLLTNIYDLVNPNDIKFLPLDQLENMTTLYYINQEVYLNIYKMLTKTLKYISQKEEYIDTYNKIKYNVAIILMGDKHV